MRDWLAELLKPLAEWLFVLVMSVPLSVVRLLLLLQSIFYLIF